MYLKNIPSLKLTAKAPEKMASQKERLVLQASIFRCYLSFREGICINKKSLSIYIYIIYIITARR